MCIYIYIHLYTIYIHLDTICCPPFFGHRHLRTGVAGVPMHVADGGARGRPGTRNHLHQKPCAVPFFPDATKVTFKSGNHGKIIGKWRVQRENNL